MTDTANLEPREVRRRQAEEEAVARWNALHRVGTPVRYWTGFREGAGQDSCTRTPAQMLSGHTAVLWVDDESSCIALTHVQATAVWDDSVAPGGFVCATPAETTTGICGYPVESDPCPEHGPKEN